MPNTLTTLSKNIHTIALGILLVLCTSVGAQNQNPKTGTVFDDLDTSAAASTAREAEISKLQKEIATFIDQLADIEMYYAARNTKQLGKNYSLISEMNTIYDSLGINICTISNLDIDELWANVWSSKKAFSINGKIDTTTFVDQTDRYLIYRTKVDSTTSMKEFSIRTSVQFSEQLNDLLAEFQVFGLEQEINKYLSENVNALKKPTPDDFKPLVYQSFEWMYHIFNQKLPTALKARLLELAQKEQKDQLSFAAINDKYKVVFEKSTNYMYPTKYGFDAFDTKTKAWEANYQKASTGNNGFYYLPYIACLKDASNTYETYVKATFINTQDNTPKDSITFIDNSGNPADVVFAELNSYYIKINCLSTNSFITAYCKGKILGRLKIKGFASGTKRLTIVPLTNITLNGQQIQQALNNTFSQGVEQWQVTLAPTFEAQQYKNGIQKPQDEGMAQYSTDMRALRDTFLSIHPEYERDKSTYLVFVVPSFIDEQGKQLADWQGYMPRGRGMGFVTSSAMTPTSSSTPTFSVLLHELGHGAYGLKHSWEEDGGKQNLTQNLLDYTQGTQLTMHQWEEMKKRHLLTYKDDVDDAAMKGKPTYFGKEEGELVTYEYEMNISSYGVWGVTSTPYKVTEKWYWHLIKQEYIDHRDSSGYNILDGGCVGKNINDCVASLPRLYAGIKTSQKIYHQHVKKLINKEPIAGTGMWLNESQYIELIKKLCWVDLYFDLEENDVRPAFYIKHNYTTKAKEVLEKTLEEIRPLT